MTPINIASIRSKDDSKNVRPERWCHKHQTAKLFYEVDPAENHYMNSLGKRDVLSSLSISVV